MTEQFFDLLRRKGLTDSESLEDLILQRYTLGQLVDLDQELADALPHDYVTRDSYDVTDFDFWPNSELSASLGACDGSDCRLERLKRLTRFATMWADSVHISPYFGLLPALDDEMRARSWLLGSVTAMLAAEPAFKANILRIAPVGYNVCPSCEAAIDPGIPQVREILAQAKRSMHDAYFDDVRVLFKARQSTYLVTVTGPEDLLPHGEISMYTRNIDESSFRWLPQGLRQRAIAGEPIIYDVPKSRLRDSRALTEVIETVAHDVMHQHLACTMRGTKYLTNRPADKLFLDAINDNDSFASLNPVLAQHLSYEMPILNGVPLEDLIDLRTHDYDAFLVYRDTLKALIREHIAKGSVITGKEASEIYNDEVRPELNKMNLKLKSVRDKLSSRLRRDVIIAGGIVVLGLSSGLILPPLALSAGAAVPSAIGAAKSALERADASDELKSDNLYFLWKASQKSGRN